MARPSTEQIGTAIASVLAQANVSQTDLARRLTARGWAVDQSRVSKWVRGVGEPHALLIYPAIEDECGVPKGTIFRRAGLVDDVDSGDLEHAIAMASDLDDDGRNMLTNMYLVLKNEAARRAQGTAASAAPAR